MKQFQQYIPQAFYVSLSKEFIILYKGLRSV